MGCFLTIHFCLRHFLIYRSFHQPNHNPKTPLVILLVQEPLCRLLHVNYQRHRPIPQHRMVLPPQEAPNTRMRVGFFELPVALAVQALLPHVQDQAGGITSITISRGEAQVEVGHEIGMLKIPMFEREHRCLRDGRIYRRQLRRGRRRR